MAYVLLTVLSQFAKVAETATLENIEIALRHYDGVNAIVAPVALDSVPMLGVLKVTNNAGLITLNLVDKTGNGVAVLMVFPDGDVVIPTDSRVYYAA